MPEDTIRKVHCLHRLACQPLLNILSRYFSASSSLDISAWSTDGSALSRCGHCDNCTRDPDSIERKDVTLETWKVLKVSQTISAEGGRTTLGMLADLIRGAGGGAFDVSSGSRGKSKGQGKQKSQLDLDSVCHGKVDLRKDVSLLCSQLSHLCCGPDFLSGRGKPPDYTAPFGLSEGRIRVYVIHHKRLPCARRPGPSYLAAFI